MVDGEARLLGHDGTAIIRASGTTRIGFVLPISTNPTARAPVAAAIGCAVRENSAVGRAVGST
jgi:hypothetical protein